MEMQALLLWLGAPHWTAGDLGKVDAAKHAWQSRGVLEVQGWTRPEVAPIPAADHWPIMCNYLHLRTGEIKGRMDTHVHTHTFKYIRMPQKLSVRKKPFPS